MKIWVKKVCKLSRSQVKQACWMMSWNKIWNESSPSHPVRIHTCLKLSLRLLRRANRSAFTTSVLCRARYHLPAEFGRIRRRARRRRISAGPKPRSYQSGNCVSQTCAVKGLLAKSPSAIGHLLLLLLGPCTFESSGLASLSRLPLSTSPTTS